MVRSARRRACGGTRRGAGGCHGTGGRGRWGTGARRCRARGCAAWRTSTSPGRPPPPASAPTTPPPASASRGHIPPHPPSPPPPLCCRRRGGGLCWPAPRDAEMGGAPPAKPGGGTSRAPSAPATAAALAAAVVRWWRGETGKSTGGAGGLWPAPAEQPQAGLARVAAVGGAGKGRDTKGPWIQTKIQTKPWIQTKLESLRSLGHDAKGRGMPSDGRRRGWQPPSRRGNAAAAATSARRTAAVTPAAVRPLARPGRRRHSPPGAGGCSGRWRDTGEAGTSRFLTAKRRGGPFAAGTHSRMSLCARRALEALPSRPAPRARTPAQCHSQPSAGRRGRRRATHARTPAKRQVRSPARPLGGGGGRCIAAGNC